MPKYRIKTDNGTYEVEVAGDTEAPPYEGSGVFQPRSFVGGTGANRLRDDSPPEEPGMLESMGRRMFQGAAQPETGGDFLGLATAAPMMGVAAAGQGISKAVGVIRSRMPSRPTQEGIGQGFQSLGRSMPSPFGIARPVQEFGRRLTARARRNAPQRSESGTAVPNADNARGGTTPPRPVTPDTRPDWVRPTAENLPDSTRARGGTTPPRAQDTRPDWIKPAAENLPDSANATGSRWDRAADGPHLQWQKPVAEGLPDSFNATGSSHWLPERPIPSHRPVSTGTGASAPLQTPNVGWKQGTPKPAASHARNAIIEQMKPDIRIPEQILADPKQLAIAAKALGLSVEELLKRQAQNFLSSNLNKF